jgi:nucleoside phosphorylase
VSGPDRRDLRHLLTAFRRLDQDGITEQLLTELRKKYPEEMAALYLLSRESMSSPIPEDHQTVTGEHDVTLPPTKAATPVPTKVSGSNDNRVDTCRDSPMPPVPPLSPRADASTFSGGFDPPPPFTVGQLLALLENTRENVTVIRLLWKIADNTPVGWHWAVREASASELPEADRLEILCEERFEGTGLTAQNVRRLRAELARRRKCSPSEVDFLTLAQMADNLTAASAESKLTREGDRPDAVQDLAAYKFEEQPWWTPLPPTKNVRTEELASFAGEIDIVLITATDPELEAVLRHLEPYPRRKAVLKVFAEQETYYLGKFGASLAAVTKCRMGSLDSGGATLATEHAQRVWRPRAIVMVGIALGKDPEKQEIADVLVASQVISYEPQRVGEKQTVNRGPISPANPTLLNRFDIVPQWSFRRPDGSKCKRQVGPILSGEKLVDAAAFKASLLHDHPQAIGGDMEGVGLAAAAVRHGVPWILVKAICDWGDGKKDEKHQALAAAAAASLVHHALSQTDVLDGLHKPN